MFVILGKRGNIMSQEAMAESFQFPWEMVEHRTIRGIRYLFAFGKTNSGRTIARQFV